MHPEMEIETHSWSTCSMYSRLQKKRKTKQDKKIPPIFGFLSDAIRCLPASMNANIKALSSMSRTIRSYVRTYIHKHNIKSYCVEAGHDPITQVPY